MTESPASTTPTKEASAQTPAPASAEQRHPLLALREEMDRLYDDFFSGFPLMPFGRRRPMAEPRGPLPGFFGANAAPSVDVVERDYEYCITAELPGMEEKDMELSVANGILTLKGEKKQEREEKKEDYYVSERRFGSVQRSFRMPENADLDKIEARFKNGVLTIVLPKNPATAQATKKIAVKAG